MDKELKTALIATGVTIGIKLAVYGLLRRSVKKSYRAQYEKYTQHATDKLMAMKFDPKVSDEEFIAAARKEQAFIQAIKP